MNFLIFDLDGVIYRNEDVMPFVAELFEYLDKKKSAIAS